MGMKREHSDSDDGGSGDLIVFAAGTVCIDVSSMGGHAGLLGPSCRPLAIFLAEVKAVQPHLVVHECTGQFLRAVFEEHLPEYDIYVIHKPEDMTRLRE